MRKLADDLWLVDGFPRNAINCFVSGGVLFDAAARWNAGSIRRQIANRDVHSIALTHVHPDHQGSVHQLCSELGLRLLCPAGEVDYMDGTRLMPAAGRLGRIMRGLASGPPHPVDTALVEGDRVGDWRVVDTPGHTPGHVIYVRDRDRTVIAGDVLNNMHLVTMAPGLREPPAALTLDPAQNRLSILRLAALDPVLTVFGHGAEEHGAAGIRRLAESLAVPRDR